MFNNPFLFLGIFFLLIGSVRLIYALVLKCREKESHAND